MGEIEEELKQLVDEQKSAVESVEVAVAALAQSQRGLSDAKARKNGVMQRLAPLQQFVTNLEKSTLAVERQAEAAARELEEAQKLREDVFKTVSEEIDKKALQALESAEASVRESEEVSKALVQKVWAAETARNTAQTDANASEARMRDLSVELASLPNQIQSARQRVAALMTSARNAFAAGETEQTFLTLRDLQIQSEELSKVAAEEAKKQLLEAIEAERIKTKKAQGEVAAQTSNLTKSKEDLAALDKEIQAKRQRAKDARAALTGESRPA